MPKILISAIAKDKYDRFYLIDYRDHYLSTGLILDMYQEGKWVAGKIDHSDPKGYYFAPDADSKKRTYLVPNIIVRMSLPTREELMQQINAH